jgi:hypothetical protein
MWNESHGLFYGIIPAFAWKDWEPLKKQKKTYTHTNKQPSALLANLWAEIQTWDLTIIKHEY